MSAGRVVSVNVGQGRAIAARSATSGIDKRPVSGRVLVRAPGPKGTAGSGLEGDAVCNRRHHGGDDQAVYAYASEDLAAWAVELDRPLAPGMFGENLTTADVDVTGARVGERWRVGDRLVLAVTGPRIPCRNFATWLGEPGWIRRFTERARPGAYLRVVEPGDVGAGDRIRVVDRPDHEITIAFMLRALTNERDLLPRLLEAEPHLTDEERRLALAATR